MSPRIKRDKNGLTLDVGSNFVFYRFPNNTVMIYHRNFGHTGGFVFNK